MTASGVPIPSQQLSPQLVMMNTSLKLLTVVLTALQDITARVVTEINVGLVIFALEEVIPQLQPPDLSVKNVQKVVIV
jgi:hypothetical protein